MWLRSLMYGLDLRCLRFEVEVEFGECCLDLRLEEEMDMVCGLDLRLEEEVYLVGVAWISDVWLRSFMSLRLEGEVDFRG